MVQECEIKFKMLPVDNVM